MADPKAEQIHDSGASEAPLVPKIYINGFSVGMSLSDIYIYTEIAGSPSAMLLMSFTTAKTLAQHLGQVVADFEEMTGQKLLSMDDIQSALKAKVDEKAEQ
jgi:hypothetical protein